MMKNLRNVSLKHKLIIILPVISAAAWISVSMYNYAQVGNVVDRISDKYMHEWVSRFSRIIVDDIRSGNVHGLRRTSYEMFEGEVVDSAYVYNAKGKLLIKFPPNSKNVSRSSIDTVENGKGEAIANKNLFYFYPIADQYGIVWGELYVKPSYDISTSVIQNRMNAVIVFGFGLFLVQIGILVWLLNAMFRPIEYVTSEIARLTRGNRSGSIDVEGLNALVEGVPEGEVKQLGKQLVVFAESISKYQEQVLQNAALVAIGEISAQVAHDMRSPLSVLTTFVQHRESSGDSDEREFAAAAHRSVRKLLNMADDFLDYGKAKILSRSPCNLKQIYEDIVEPECSEVVRNKGLTIDLNIDEHLYANFDAHKVGRVMTNLILNAARAVDKGIGHIEVTAMEGGEGELIIIVSDDGCGIPCDDLEKIYENFYSTDKRLGTGLGLSYCKQVVGVHDGTIDVRSEVDKGTIFTITLPDCVISEQKALNSVDDPKIGALPVKKRTGVPGPEKVLIVDDDDDIRTQWKQLIDDRDARILYFASSVEEVQSSLGVDYTMIDTAIVDYEYKGEDQNGIDLVAFLKRNGVSSIYLCTGHYRNEEICRRAKEAGACSVLSKPIDTNKVSELFP